MPFTLATIGAAYFVADGRGALVERHVGRRRREAEHAKPDGPGGGDIASAGPVRVAAAVLRRGPGAQSTGRPKKSRGVRKQTWSIVSLSRPMSFMARITRGTMK